VTSFTFLQSANEHIPLLSGRVVEPLILSDALRGLVHLALNLNDSTFVPKTVETPWGEQVSCLSYNNEILRRLTFSALRLRELNCCVEILRNPHIREEPLNNASTPFLCLHMSQEPGYALY
jgi:hypothetical protein